MTKKLLLLLMLVSTKNCFSQWNNNTTINNVVSNSIGEEYEPFAISDGANGSIIFFYDYNDNNNLYAQKITAAGVVAWGATATPVAICETIKDKYEFAAIPDGSGGAFITWSDYRHDDDNGEIYVQRINSAGVPQWGANGKRITTSNTQDNAGPALCTDGAGGIFVLWYWDNGTSNVQSFAQRLNGSGDVQWTANGKQVCTAPGFRGANIVVPDGSNGVLTFFIDTRNDANGLDYDFFDTNDLANADIYGQRLNSNGDRLWTDNGIGIITAIGNQSTNVGTGGISDGLGGAIIAFEDGRNDDGTDTNLDVFAQRINSNGASLWAVNGIAVSVAAGRQFLMDGISDGAGGAVFAISDNTGNKVNVQRVTAAGNALWILNGIPITQAPENAYNGSLANDGSGNTILTYGSSENDGILKAQKISAAGNFLWGTSGKIVSNATSGNSSNQVIVPSNNGSAIIAWSDYRNSSETGTDLYASKIMANGTLEGSSSTLYITGANGSWNNAATWVNGQIPPAGAAVSIRHIVTGDLTTSCTSLKVEQPAGKLTILTGVKITVTN